MALPAYDQCIKASHVFNLLDARGVISVTERQSYILRVRELAKACGEAWLATEGGGKPFDRAGSGRGSDVKQDKRTVKSADERPIAVEVEAGKNYWWCACGARKKQPFCDGSHKGSSFTPMNGRRTNRSGVLLRLQADRERSRCATARKRRCRAVHDTPVSRGGYEDSVSQITVSCREG